MHDTYKQVRVHEKEAVRALSRTKLSSSSTDDVADKDKPTVDLEPLRQTLAMQWLHMFLEWKEWPRVESTLGANDWSALCVLFPATVGGAICDWVQDQIDPVYKQVSARAIPNDIDNDCSYDYVTLSLDIYWPRYPPWRTKNGCIDFSRLFPTCAYLLAPL
jgi:hypothetical protein